MRLRVFLSFGFMLETVLCHAQAPQIQAVYPPGGPLGTKVAARIEGANLSGATGVLISESGVAVQTTGDGKDAGGIPVTLDIASDAMPGPREIRVVTPKGASNPGYVWVGNLSEVGEKEPNNQPEQAQSMDGLPITVFGRANAGEDVDFFTFKANAGETFVFDSCSFRIFSQIDCYLELTDARGRMLAMGTEGFDRDPRIIHTFKQAGVYRLQVRDTMYRGGAGYLYRVSVGKLPVLTTVFPHGGRKGQKLEAKVEGVNLGGLTTWSLDLPADRPAHRPWYAVPQTPNGPALPVELGIDDNPQFLEPGPSAANRPSAVPQLPVTVNGVIGAAGEADHYQFAGTQGQPIRIVVSARGIRSRMDPYLRIFDSAGKELQNSEEQVGRDAQLTFNPPANGAFRLEVTSLDGRGGSDYYYRIALIPPGPPDFRVSATPDVFLLGRGQTLILNVNAERRNFGGDIEVKVEGLPAGVTASPLTLASGQSSGMITVTSTVDAALSSSQMRVLGEAALDGTNRVTRPALAVGTYPRPGEGQPIPRPVAFLMASATDTVPLFTLTQEATRVEITAGQRIELKIKASRKPGDNNANPAIALTLANLPAGVKAETPNIPEKQGEVTIKLFAPEDTKPGQSIAFLSGKLGETTQYAPAILIIVKPKP